MYGSSSTGFLVLIYATSTCFVIYLWRVTGNLRLRRSPTGKGWGRGWGYVKPRGWGKIVFLGLGPSKAGLGLLKNLILMDKASYKKVGSSLGLGYLLRSLKWADPRKYLFKIPVAGSTIPVYSTWLWPKGHKNSTKTIHHHHHYVSGAHTTKWHQRGLFRKGSGKNRTHSTKHPASLLYKYSSNLHRFLRHPNLLQWVSSPRKLWQDPRVKQFCHLTAQKSALLFGGRMNGWSRMGHQRRRMNNAWYPWSVGKNSMKTKCSNLGRSSKMLGATALSDTTTSFCKLHQKQHHGVHQQQPKNSWVSMYQRIPLRTMSRLWGQFNQLELPVWLRSPALGFYVWLFQCQLDEAYQEDLSRYKNLSEFFRRKLKPGLRPVDKAFCLTSPADGRVLHFGCVQNDLLEQVKGVTYSLQGFLGPAHGLVRSKDNVCRCPSYMQAGPYSRLLLTQPQHQLYYCIIYLAPGDYHRYHAPTDWTVTARRHFPGDLFSVNPRVAQWLKDLFVLNERAVYTGRWRYGFFSMTPVGATNVGSINVNFDKSLETNVKSSHPRGTYFDRQFSSRRRAGMSQTQGELMGDFNLGSTVVLLFEAPSRFEFRIHEGQKVKYGQGLGKVTRNKMSKK